MREPGSRPSYAPEGAEAPIPARILSFQEESDREAREWLLHLLLVALVFLPLSTLIVHLVAGLTSHWWVNAALGIGAIVLLAFAVSSLGGVLFRTLARREMGPGFERGRRGN